MVHFNERFYTDDFDQQMMDFVKSKYRVVDQDRDWDNNKNFLLYGFGNDYFWTEDANMYSDKDYEYLTKQQFKEKIGMTTKQFSKKDLVAGKHVVELADGSRYLLVNVLDKVVGFNLQADSKGVHDNWYTHLEEDLVYPYNKDLSVVAAYKVVNTDVYSQCSDRNIELIWKREEKSPTQIELEKLQNQIAELQAQANKLQETL